MKKFWMCATFLTFLFSNPAFALDKDAFRSHLIKAFNLNDQTNITVGDPTNSQFAGLSSFTVILGPYTQSVYITKDERYYFWGNVFDLTLDPYKDRMSHINLTGVHSKGSKLAPVTVIAYSDIQCPNCQKAHTMIDGKLYKDFTENQVRFIFKHFPLTMHEWAEPAAVSAECAGQQGNEAFWNMLDSLYSQAPEISTATIRSKSLQISKTIKLDQNKFQSCLDSGQALAKVRSDKTEGYSVGIDATPTFVVNGMLVRGNNYDGLKAAIEEKLKSPKK